MTVREYTEAERAELAGGLSKPDFDARAGALEREFLAVCAEQTPRIIALGVATLLRAHGAPLRDLLDTIDAVCAQQGGRRKPQPSVTPHRLYPADLPFHMVIASHGAPLGVIAAAIHGVTCGNGPVRDALDALSGVIDVSAKDEG